MRTNYILKNAPVVGRVSRKCNVREESYTQKEQTNSDWKEENRKKKKKKKSTETKTRVFSWLETTGSDKTKISRFRSRICENSRAFDTGNEKSPSLPSSLLFFGFSFSLYAPFLQAFHTFLPGANSIVVFRRRSLSLQTTLKSLFFCICIGGPLCLCLSA